MNFPIWVLADIIGVNDAERAELKDAQAAVGKYTPGEPSPTLIMFVWLARKVVALSRAAEPRCTHGVDEE